MPVDHTEKGFEQAIEDHLLHNGYRKGDPANFDASLALDPKTLIEFLSADPEGRMGSAQYDVWGGSRRENR